MHGFKKRRPRAENVYDVRTRDLLLLGSFSVGWLLFVFCTGPVIRSIGAIAMVFPLFVALARCSKQGRIDTNLYTAVRAEHPIIFLLTLGFWTLFTLSFAVLLFLVANGVIHPGARST